MSSTDLGDVVRAMPDEVRRTSDDHSFTLENEAVSIFCFYAANDRAHLFIRFLQCVPKCTLSSRAPISLDDPDDKLRCAYIEIETGKDICDYFVFIPSKDASKTGFPADEAGDEHSDGFFFAHEDFFKDMSAFMELIAEKYHLRELHKTYVSDVLSRS